MEPTAFVYVLSICSRGLNETFLLSFNRIPEQREVLLLLVDLPATSSGEGMSEEFVTEMLISVRRHGIPRLTPGADMGHLEWIGASNGYTRLERVALVHLPVDVTRDETPLGRDGIRRELAPNE